MNSEQLASSLKNTWQQHYGRRDSIIQATDAMVAQFRERLEGAAEAIAVATRQPARAVVISDSVNVPDQTRKVEYGITSDATGDSLSFRVEFQSDAVRYEGDYLYNQEAERLQARMNQKIYDRFKAPERRRS